MTDKKPLEVTYQEVFETMQALYNGNFKQQSIAAEMGKTKLYITPPQRKPLPPKSPCEMTQAEGKMFKLGWLECEAAHGITGEQHG